MELKRFLCQQLLLDSSHNSFEELKQTIWEEVLEVVFCAKGLRRSQLSHLVKCEKSLPRAFCSQDLSRICHFRELSFESLSRQLMHLEHFLQMETS